MTIAEKISIAVLFTVAVFGIIGIVKDARHRKRENDEIYRKESDGQDGC